MPSQHPITVRTLHSADLPAFRQLRLQALRDSPDAFGTTYAVEAAKPDEAWRSRLEQPEAFILGGLRPSSALPARGSPPALRCLASGRRRQRALLPAETRCQPWESGWTSRLHGAVKLKTLSMPSSRLLESKLLPPMVNPNGCPASTAIALEPLNE